MLGGKLGRLRFDPAKRGVPLLEESVTGANSGPCVIAGAQVIAAPFDLDIRLAFEPQVNLLDRVVVPPANAACLEFPPAP